LLNKHNIEFFSTYSDKKAAVVERFNRTLKALMWKYFYSAGTYKWIDVLQDLTDNYNSSVNRSIKARPDSVNESNWTEVWKTLFSRDLGEPPEPKFVVGESVRISKYKSVFTKGYEANFTEEIFIVTTYRMTTIRGPRTRSVVTFNPSTISPGEELYINIPKLKPSSFLVPGSLSLLFDFKNSNTKSRFMNNLSKLLAKRLQIKVAGETAYDCSGESLFEVYKDLWLTLGDRKKMIEQGVANENLRKLLSGDDSGKKTGDTSKVADALVQSIYGTKLKKPIDKIIGDHGLHTPFTMNNNPMYIL
jgi:hypothetical protein